MVKQQPIPREEIKNVRSWGRDRELIVTITKGRPIPDSKIQNLRKWGFAEGGCGA